MLAAASTATFKFNNNLTDSMISNNSQVKSDVSEGDFNGFNIEKPKKKTEGFEPPNIQKC